MQKALTRWVAEHAQRSNTSALLAEAISIDGKELRSAKHGVNQRVHLLSACTHDTGTILGQVDVNAKTNEISRLPELLEDLSEQYDLTGRTITLDALHTQRDTAKLITHTYQAHYVFTLKGNQPTLHAQVKDLPWKQVPVTDTTIDTSHGRLVIRKLQLATVKERMLPAWPGLKQVGRITRERIRNGVTSTEVVYVLTSLPSFLAGPAYLADAIRGHWSVENKVHWVRDVTFNEDKNQVRTGFAPRNLAALTNAVLTAFRMIGVKNIAETASELHASHRLIRQVLEAV
ncbi:ISAs1 family transposase [Glutamicibacter uratoxydans]|uniref:ISAs1 family transposase n=1 Tax=Glutamicibacter uratoxydans TaxID=43667 RepID=UPI003D6FF495